MSEIREEAIETWVGIIERLTRERDEARAVLREAQTMLDQGSIPHDDQCSDLRYCNCGGRLLDRINRVLGDDPR